VLNRGSVGSNSGGGGHGRGSVGLGSLGESSVEVRTNSVGAAHPGPPVVPRLSLKAASGASLGAVRGGGQMI